MIPLDVALVFFFASVALALSPGPDNIFVLIQSAVHGKVTGLLITLGLCTGLIAHTTIVALGVAVIFQTSVWALAALKVVGAIYLLYLAWQVFNAGASKINSTDDKERVWYKYYFLGVFMNITNPKVAIFFLAFLPQFSEPERGSMTAQILMLGGLFMLAAWVTFSTIALLASSIGHWLKQSTKAQVVMNKVAGVVLAGLAVKLVVTEA